MLPLRRLTRHLLSAALLLPAISQAQTADTPPLSLQDAEKRLLDANPTILQARAAVAGARAGIDIAGARPNPIVTASVTSINPTRSGNGGYWDRPVDNVLRVDQMIERGDKRDLRLAAADRNLAATGLDLDNTIRLARIELASAWVDLRAAREVRRIADENAALARRAADAAEVRGKAGDLAGVDVARFAADAARVANDAVQAELALSRARIALARLLGNRLPAGTLQTTDDWPGDDAVAPAQTDAERVDILAARQRVAQASALRELARAQRTRDVSVGVQYEHYPPDGRNTYGVSISVPLFLGYDYRGDIARSEADYTTAEQQLDATRQSVASEQARLQAELAAARSRHARLRDVVLPAAERAGRGADVAIQKGGMSLTDYLDTQRNLRAARIEAVQARADVARAALILRLAGATP
ncbi:TolC family protein [uncultured Zoogloea sp.]|uniref:TolC family protein n=1 Tax=uncultured Zoogloea sp. TaxID=160237 RepID=UPI00261F781E|nr:TolC family protein [uncultured Zoogloea sp.]